MRGINCGYGGMEYPMQDFDIDEETDFLLGGTSRNNGSDMDNYYTTTSRAPHRRRGLAGVLCG